MQPRENELRLSDEIRLQLRDPAVRAEPAGWLAVMEVLQRRVCREFGLSEEVGLEAMRCADSLLPNDPEVKEISLYRKYNRCVDGPVVPGDAMPCAALHPLGDLHCTVPLHELLDQCQTDRLVLVAGSYS